MRELLSSAIDFSRSVLWRMTTGWLAWLWVPGVVASAWIARSGSPSLMWEDALRQGVLDSFPIVTLGAVLAALTSGLDRHSYLTGPRYATRAQANQSAIIAAAWIQVVLGMGLVTLVELLSFSDTAQLRWFSPLVFVAGAALAGVQCAFGGFMGARLPLWLSLPLVPVICWVQATFCAAKQGTWPALFSYLDSGFFAPYVAEPRSSVLTAQICIGFAAIIVFTLAAGFTKWTRRLATGPIVAASLMALVACLILNQTGPARSSKHLVSRARYCQGRVCGVADAAAQVRAAAAFLTANPALLQDVPATTQLVDEAAGPEGSEVVVSIGLTSPQDARESVAVALIKYHWCVATRQGKVNPNFADVNAAERYVTLSSKSPNRTVQLPAAPKGLACSAR